jgi:trimeric autotransporter adhesin
MLAVLLAAGCASDEEETPSPDAGVSADAAPGAVTADAQIPADLAGAAADSGVTPDVRAEPLLVLQPTVAEVSGVVGTDAAPLRFTLANAGDTAIGIPQVLLIGTHMADFRISANGCMAPLAPMTTCLVEVTFRPVALGVRSATLQVSAQPGGMAQATIEGSAIGTDGFALEGENPLDFGGVPVGTTSPPKTLTVRNTGGAPGMIGTVNISSTEFVPGTNTCAGATLAPNTTCAIQIAFRPTSVGIKTGTVMVSAGAVGQGVATLVGTGL